MEKILIATQNPGKFGEISSFLSDLPLELVSLMDVGIIDDVEETGRTYEENSVKKAAFYAKKSGLPTIADDGGIEIDALDGDPGVHSRRYFVPPQRDRAVGGSKNGKGATDEEIIAAMKKLIKTLSSNKLGATFKVVITLAMPNGETFSVNGEIRGTLKDSHLKILHGYPYRSFFFLPKLHKYYHESELSEKEQKLYNHRYKAIQKLKPIIIKQLGL